MSQLIDLIKEFPNGSLFVICILLFIVYVFVNRIIDTIRSPNHTCDCHKWGPEDDEDIND